MEALLLLSVVVVLAGLVFSVVGIPLALSVMPVLLVMGLLNPRDVPAAVERGVEPVVDDEDLDEPIFEWPPFVPPIWV